MAESARWLQLYEKQSQPRTDISAYLMSPPRQHPSRFNVIHFQDNLFKDAMEYAAESKNAEVAEVSPDDCAS